MHRSIRPAALCLALLASSGAFANDQIHKCIDPNGATVLSDKPCAVIESLPADSTAAVSAATPGDPGAVPAVIAERPQVVKEYYRLPAAEIDHARHAKKPLASAPPKVDVATLKAARLKLELEDKTASLRQASLD